MPGNEIMDLARDFASASKKVQRALVDVAEDVGDETAEQWQSNVRSWTRGLWSEGYPESITATTKFSLGGFDIEVGPEASKGKRWMMGRGFEFGSQNAPAHADGLAAQQATEPKLEQSAADALDRAMP